ncbi:MAG TPA: hypothetical protein DCL54_15025, partial [Alphaproteobacteria bacterium]|nr:hypothetical protein [Alphaproteobacteria bacterium]
MLCHLDVADRATLDRHVRDYVERLDAGSVGLVYYAGHGIEVGGVNYLIPVEAKLSDADFVELEAVPGNLAQQMAKRAKGVNIVVLDACRDNPFVPKMRSVGGGRSVGTRGLAAVEAGGVSVLALAAKAGSVAQDGEGTNGPYAAALAKHIATPGIELRLMFGRVRDEVMTLTKGKQEPFIYESLGGKEYFLAEGPRPQAGGASAPAPVARTLSPDDWRKRIQELTPGTPTERYAELFGTARHIEFPGTVAGVANVEYRVYAAGPFEVYHVLSGRKPVGLGLRTMPGTQEKGPYWPKDGDFQSMDEATPDRTSNATYGCTGELKFGGERAAVFVLTPPCQFGAYPGGVTTQAFAYA